MKHQNHTPARPILVLTFTLLALPALAHAQAPMEGTQRAPDLVTQAKAAYELGMTAYGLGHFDRAIDSFTKAYELDPAPVLLYNIAQSHWKKGNPEQAIVFYRRYLEADPQAENRTRVKTRIRELEVEMKQNPRPMPMDPTAVAPSPSGGSAGAGNAPAASRTTASTGVLGAAATAAPDVPSGRGSAPPPPPPEPRAKGTLAATTPEASATTPPAAPAAGGSPYWQPSEGAGIPAAGKPAPMDTSSVMPPVAPIDLASDKDPPPLYRRPWFWAGVGTATLLTVAAVFLLRPDQRSWTCSECVSTRVVP
jgi:hypothetical protein